MLLFTRLTTKLQAFLLLFEFYSCSGFSPAMLQQSRQLCVQEGKYIFSLDGRRDVSGYVHTFEANVKGSWIGESLLDVYTFEFPSYSRAYFKDAIVNGLLTVNGEFAAPERRLKESDVVRHITHRHEPAVFGAGQSEIEILADTEQLLVVNKPSSLPVHPAGAYNFNTLVRILER